MTDSFGNSAKSESQVQVLFVVNVQFHHMVLYFPQVQSSF